MHPTKKQEKAKSVLHFLAFHSEKWIRGCWTANSPYRYFSFHTGAHSYIKKGDVGVLYTDAIFSMMNPHAPFEKAREGQKCAARFSFSLRKLD